MLRLDRSNAKLNPCSRPLSDRRRSLPVGIRRAALAGAVATAVLLGSLSASANPTVESKRAEAAAVLEQVRVLDAQVERAGQEWNLANTRLGALSGELSATRIDLRRARRLRRLAERRLAARLVSLYEVDRPSPLDVFLGARTLTDVIDAVDIHDRFVRQDEQIAGEVTRYRDRVAAQEKRLKRARAEQADLVRRRAAERAAVEQGLAQRKQLLASVQAEVARLEAEQRAREALLRQKALAELAARRRAAAERQAQAKQAETTAAAAPVIAPTREPAVAPSITAQVAPSPSPATTPDASPASPGGRGDQVVAIAMRYLGVPYLWGGASPSSGFDCSGLTMYAYGQIGISLPHYTGSQWQMGSAVSQSDLQPGDLVFFNNLGHEGMYVGGGNFIHAPHTGDVVKISSLSESWYMSTYMGARRVL